MTEQTDEILDHALAYQTWGWHLLPLHILIERPRHLENEPGQTRFICTCHKTIGCHTPGKHPSLRAGIYGATNDYDKIHHWFSLHIRAGTPSPGIGILTGSQSGIIVLDIESRGTGMTDLEDLRAKHGDHWFDETRSILTGSGGIHFYYRYVEGFGGGALHPFGLGFDIMADGQFVVAPPSLHYSGRKYKWRNNKPIIDCPPWLFDFIKGYRKRDEKVKSSDIRSIGTTDRVGRCRLYLDKVDGAVNGNGGWSQTKKVCGLGHEFGLTVDEFWPLLLEWNEKCTSVRPGEAGPWDHDDLRKKLEAVHDRCTSAFGWRLSEPDKNRRPEPPPIGSTTRRIQRDGARPPDPPWAGRGLASGPGGRPPVDDRPNRPSRPGETSRPREPKTGQPPRDPGPADPEDEPSSDELIEESGRHGGGEEQPESERPALRIVRDPVREPGWDDEDPWWETDPPEPTTNLSDTRGIPPPPAERYVATLADGYPQTELGNAQRIYDTYGEYMRWCDKWGTWAIWGPAIDMMREEWGTRRIDGETVGRWIVDDTRAAQLFAFRSARLLHKFEVTVPKDEKKSFIAFVKGSEKETGINGALSKLKTLVPASADDFDRSHFLLNCESGTIDLRTLELRPWKKSDLITKYVKAPWDTKASCTRWNEFLLDVMEGNQELVDYIQRAVGYSITGDTREQCFFLCEGDGNNGKGTFLKTILRMLGAYGMNANMATFVEKKGDVIPNDLARMRGARYITAQEKSSNRNFDEALLKTLTGEDPITARFLRAEFFEYYPTFKIWLAMNGLPDIKGDDEGIWRRIRLIKWLVILPAERMDKSLNTRLADEFPGILRWAAEGTMQWLQRGLDEPEVMRSWLRQYRQEEDTVAQWMSMRCRFSPDARETADRLFGDYQSWVRGRGHHPFGIKKWSARLMKRSGITKTKTGNVFYQGLELRRGDQERQGSLYDSN